MRPIRQNPEQNGFVLITALWLLLLCGAVVASMMLRSANRVEINRSVAARVQARLDLDAAVETIAADILFRGGQSRWARSPAQGSIDIDGRSLSVDVSSEAGRLDLNDGDPAIIDRALQGLGVPALGRARIASDLQRLHTQKHRIASAAKVSKLLDSSGISGDLCLDNYVTLYSGMSRPSESLMPAELAQALAVPQGRADQPEAMPAGTPIRIRVRSPQGASLIVVIRIVGTIERSFDVLRWTSNPAC